MRPGLDITVTELQFCVCFIGVLIYLMCVCLCRHGPGRCSFLH